MKNIRYVEETNGQIHFDRNGVRYARRDVHEDRVKYEPTRKKRVEQGRTMWSHVEVTTSLGTETVKSKPLWYVAKKYRNTILSARYVLRRGGSIVKVGKPHLF